MKKILIIGSSGAGKSAFAKALSRILGIPVCHLDVLYWKPDWTESPPDEFEAKQREILENEVFIIDGYYGLTFPMRLDKADTVFWLDFNRFVCFYSAVKRRIKHRNKVRSDMGSGCVEKIDKMFVMWILYHYPKQRKRIFTQLSEWKGNVVIFKNRRRMKEYLKSIDNCGGAGF